jgi:DNA-binding NtrC family response regulator
VIWADPLTERVIALACQVARADVPVLITGPNGAGKERIADIIQANSAVKGGPFVTLNCGALPSELIEAELFGAEAGAYTGASKAREGQVRGRRWRHAVPRRDRQPAPRRAGEAAAGP